MSGQHIGSDVGRRLERAHRQYENLLMHAGDVLLEKEPGTPFSGSSFDSTPIRHGTGIPASPDLQKSFYESPDEVIPEKDKDSIILSLQEEIERLREKLEGTISSVEGVILDAQTAQEDIQTEYDSKIYDLTIRNSYLEDENYQLKVTLDLASAELAVERDNLRKAARFIERLKRRGREYTDAQRRSHSVLVATTSAHHTHRDLASPTHTHTNTPVGAHTHTHGYTHGHGHGHTPMQGASSSAKKRDSRDSRDGRDSRDSMRDSTPTSVRHSMHTPRSARKSL
jgi:hypothetical protein